MKGLNLVLKAIRLSAAVAVLLASPAARGQEKITLREKLEKLSRTRMVTTMEMSMDMKMPDLGATDTLKDMQIKMTQIQEVLLHVIDVDAEGITTIEMTYDRLAHTMDMGEGKKVSFDSKNPEKAQGDAPFADFSAALKPLVGAKLTIKVDKERRVIGVKGLDAMWKAIGTGEVQKQMQKLFGDKQVKKMMEDFMARDLPPHPVAVGESWSADKELEMPMFGKIRTKGTNTLVGVEQHNGKRCAKMRLEAKITSAGTQPVETPGSVLPGMKIRKYDLKGVQWFDIDAGQLLETELDQDVQMGMTLPGGLSGRDATASRPTSGLTMEQRMRGKTRIVATPEPTTQPK